MILKNYINYTEELFESENIKEKTFVNELIVSVNKVLMKCFR